MKTNLLKLKSQRTELDSLKEVFEKKQQQFIENNKQLLDAIQQLKEEITNNETEIKESAISDYQVNGEKHIGFGVKIQERKTIEYDEGMAFAFAKEHNLFLALDKKAFENYAKDTATVDFVKYGTKIIATIPANIEVEKE